MLQAMVVLRDEIRFSTSGTVVRGRSQGYVPSTIVVPFTLNNKTKINIATQFLLDRSPARENVLVSLLQCISQKCITSLKGCLSPPTP